MNHPQKKRHSTKTPLGHIFQIAYRVTLITSVLVVALFFAYSAFVREPEVAPPATASPDATPATDNPATGDDESLATPTLLQRKKQFHTFLLMGCDDGNGNADTIMVASYDVKNKQVGLVSVPRDTLVDVRRTVKKINGAYGSGGIDEVKTEVSTLLGIPIDHYIQIDISAFQAVVTEVGGIDFYVPQDMYHDDGGGFIIDLKEGQQHLNGRQALELVRFRGYPNADIGRIAVQQQFLSAMAKKLLSFSSVTKVRAFADIFATYVKTDLTAGNLAYFAVEAMSLDTATGLKTATLPGDGLTSYKGIDYYYELFPEETLAIINDCLNPYTTPITADKAHIFQVP
ncbi:MAG: LCP family protein [Oscillospiraceae bacterium]